MPKICLRLRYALDIPEICLIYVTNIYAWFIFLIYTYYIHVILGFTLDFSWNCLRYGRYIYVRYTRDLPELCQDKPKICLKYLPKIWLRFTWYMREVCVTCIWDMLEILLKFSNPFRMAKFGKNSIILTDWLIIWMLYMLICQGCCSIFALKFPLPTAVIRLVWNSLNWKFKQTSKSIFVCINMFWWYISKIFIIKSATKKISKIF